MDGVNVRWGCPAVYAMFFFRAASPLLGTRVADTSKPVPQACVLADLVFSQSTHAEYDPSLELLLALYGVKNNRFVRFIYFRISPLSTFPVLSAQRHIPQAVLASVPL